MKIFFINNIGSGFASEIDIPHGTTLGQLFSQQMPNEQAADYLIRLNRQPAAQHELLTPGCRVSITPVKIEGAFGRYMAISHLAVSATYGLVPTDAAFTVLHAA